MVKLDGGTYTMFGDNSRLDSTPKLIWGIMPRACWEIFQAVDYRSTSINHSIAASLSVSYVEIYGN
jgi:hypothetical protein